MPCKNHIEILSEFHCVACDGYFCRECIKVRRLDKTFAYICKECGGRLENIQLLRKKREELTEELRQIKKSSDFRLLLPESFIYPLKEMGIPRILILTILFLSSLISLSINFKDYSYFSLSPSNYFYY